MRILLLTSHLNIGGIAVYTVTLANYLRRKGHLVYVASSGGVLEGELTPDIKRLKVPLNTKSAVSPRILSVIFKLRRLIKEEDIQIIHAQTRVAQFAAHLIRKLTSVPYVVTWHGFYRPHFFRKVFPCWGERTIAISRTVLRHLVDVFRRDENKARLIFNGIDTSKFNNDYPASETEAIRRKYGLGNGPVIGIISRLAPEKGHIYLIEGFKELLTKIPEAQLVIVGNGMMEGELKKRVHQLGIDNAVRFFNETLNTKEFLGVMDIFTRPSIEEGFGLGVVEAMLMGLPIVSTDVGGFKSVLDHSRVGILVPPKDAVALKDAFVYILSDSELAKRFGETARRYALENFSADRMTQQIEAVYEEVLNEKG